MKKRVSEAAVKVVTEGYGESMDRARAPSSVGMSCVAVLRGRVAALSDAPRGDGVEVGEGTIGTMGEFGADVPWAHIDGDGRLPSDGRVAVLYSALVGSRAQGLEVEGSDIDRRGFYIASPSVHFRFGGPPAQLVCDADQLCYWELEKFLRLALASNPTVLETLYSPAVEIEGECVAAGLRELKRSHAFLSKRAEQTFVRYADSQFQKMDRARGRHGSFRWGHAMHLIRLLRVAIALVRTGGLDVVVPEDDRGDLLAIKRGEWSWDEVCGLRDVLMREFADAASTSRLPDKPDVRAVEAFLLQLRVLCVLETSV